MNDIDHTSIPEKRNVLIAISSYSLALYMLWMASHSDTWYTLVFSAIIFSYISSTIFCLLHESVHGLFSANRKINNSFGRISAAFFPTGFTFQKICHLGHHRRNRTDAEMFDYYTQRSQRWISYYRLYCLLSGFYWLAIPVGCLLYLILQPLLGQPFFYQRFIQPMGFGPMIKDLLKEPRLRMKYEITGSILFQVGLFMILDLSLLGWGACYVAFALNWCSFQYTDHAWTVRDIKNGAWNFKVNTLVRYLFLNYHYHLAHHQNPHIPWIHLPQFVDDSLYRPSFLKIYLSLWAGPRYTTEPAPSDRD